MASLPVLTGVTNPFLRGVSIPIVKVDKSIGQLIKRMEETVKKEKGVGLAAPQVGKNVRLILVQMKGKRFMPMINPKIREFSSESLLDEEGCLSVPGEYGKVWRAKSLVVEFLNERGAPQILRLSDFEARIVQHEIDHLEGVLFTDRLAEAENPAVLAHHHQSL